MATTPTPLLNSARVKLERGELSLGANLRVARSLDVPLLMKSAGFDWVFIDLEHGAMSIEAASGLALAALTAGIAPIVRVPKGEFPLATRLLDNGALGIVVPHVDTADEARLVVEKLRYPPAGHRAVFSALPQFGFRAMKPAAMTAAFEAAMLVVVMLESRDAIENSDAIAAVPGIDVLLIGTGDLSWELGIPGELGDAKIATAYERVIAACAKHNKWPGMGGVYAEPLMQRYIGMGARFCQAAGDMAMILDAAERRLGFLRGLDSNA